MKRIRNPELINKRCELIQSMGLEIWHEDFSLGYNSFNLNLEFDLSGTSEEYFVRELIKQAYYQGLEQGKKEQQEAVRKILGIGNE